MSKRSRPRGYETANFEAAHRSCRVTGLSRDVTVFVCPNLLRRAIDNVLRNAIRYAPAGTEIRLDCRADENLHHVILEVLDCGPGVPESMLADIFRPFYRTAPGRASSSGGIGLGLAIASEAVRLHHGTITARNRPSGGLQVTITLPWRMCCGSSQPFIEPASFRPGRQVIGSQVDSL
jgi:two-component system, OmpR family, sensor histidine kinase CpxA